MGAVRKHSVFGDYYYCISQGDKPSSSELCEIANYNTLWKKYLSSLGWGDLPTEKGFEEWLTKNGVEVEKQC